MNLNTPNRHNTDIPPNTPRPKAFIQVKHVIMQAKTQIDINEANKMICRYIYDVCEKPLREEHMLDLQTILDWKIDDLDLPRRELGIEDEAETRRHKNMNGAHQRLHPDAKNTDFQ